MCDGQATRGERGMKGLPGHPFSPKAGLPPKESTGRRCDGPGGRSWHGKSLDQVVKLAEEEYLLHIMAGLQGGDLALSLRGDGCLEPYDGRIPRSCCCFFKRSCKFDPKDLKSSGR